MDETDLFEELLNIKTDHLSIKLEGETKKNIVRPKIIVSSSRGPIKEETLKKIIAAVDKNNAKLVLKSYGALEITF